MSETLKVGDKVIYVGALLSRNKEYQKARSGKIYKIIGTTAVVKAKDGTVFNCDLRTLVKE